LSFTEQNTVEDLIRDRLARGGEGLAAWKYISGKELLRDDGEVLVVPNFRGALERINIVIAEKPDRADEVFHKLQAAIIGSSSGGLVAANEVFRSWLLGEQSMPFGENGEHVAIRLIDFEDVDNNDFVVAQQVTFTQGSITSIFDLVLYVNGIPLVLVEAKTPIKPSVSWVDAADEVHSYYEVAASRFFVPNAFSVACDGKELRYGTVRMPLLLWGPWRSADQTLFGLSETERAVAGLLDRKTVLDMLRYFTVFATDKKHQKIKIIARYQQYEGANKVVARVLDGSIKQGLIWHFQGSGKSLLMVFAAQKLRLTQAIKNPTVLIVVDRVDLDTQITATFNAADVPNMEAADSQQQLEALLAQDARKVIITTIHKFGNAEGVLNERDNIIVLVDEAHRTQEGDYGMRMREALPNAFLFGLTGTPINKIDRNTFKAFGAAEDESGYMSLYSFSDSIRDGATLPLNFEARLVELRVDREAIDAEFERMAGRLSEDEKDELSKRAAKLNVLLKAPERVAAVTADIAQHFEEHVDPNGLKAQVVTLDREACVLYKESLDELLGPDASAIVMDTGSKQTKPEWKEKYSLTRDQESELLDRFRDPMDPLKILIVTAKLLTGFDAPILQTMYLDKPLRDHNLLQAICRTNRPYEGKDNGLIVDYLGIFDDVGQALVFDDESMKQTVTNIEELREEVPGAMEACLKYFPEVDRTVSGYEGMEAALDCLRTNEVRDAFAADYSYLQRHWEALSPDAVLVPFKNDYKWLSAVYETAKPPGGQGKLLWHTHGAKTMELIHENVHVEAIRDDLETLVMDADVLDGIIKDTNPKRKSSAIEIKILRRLKAHQGKKEFVALGERLENLRERHAQGLLLSIDYLKALTDLAKDLVAAERAVEPEEDKDLGKAALTELFESTKTPETPMIVERIVNDIDEIVDQVRFPDWQQTHAGEKLVKQALRKTLLKYKLHKDQELFENAYGYIRQYY
jgi:type I restriction enzyme R subunit